MLVFFYLFANYRYFCITDQQPSQKVADLLSRGALNFNVMKHSTKNLKVPTPEQAREYGRRGGIASQKATKRRKMWKDIISAMLEAPATEADKKQIREQFNLSAAEAKNLTVSDYLMAKLITKAKRNGDLKTVELVGKIAKQIVERSEMTIIEEQPLFADDKDD